MAITVYKKFSELPSALEANQSDELEILQNGVVKRVTVNKLTSLVPGPPGTPGGSFTGPSALIGLTPVIGVAPTGLSSDSAPALDVGISPNWTSTHTFSNAATAIRLSSATPRLVIANSTGGADAKNWALVGDSATTLSLVTRTDADAAADKVFEFTRTGSVPTGLNFGLNANPPGITGGTNFGSGGTSTSALNVRFISVATPVMTLYRMPTSVTSPTGTLSAQVLGSYRFGGYDSGTATVSLGPTIRGTATENWVSSRGAKLDVVTTPNGSTAAVVSQTWQGTQALFNDGTVAAPSAAFLNEVGTGLSRIGSGNIALSIGGVKVADITPTTFNVTSTTLQVNGVPVGTGSGTVSSVAVTAANGISASVANPGTTPNLTFTLGAITPSSVASTGTVTGTNLTGTHTGSSSGTNTGDQTISLTGEVTGSGTGSFAATINKAIAPTWTGTHTFTPVSGRAFLANGVANQFVASFGGSGTAGQSYGLFVNAGTNTTDNALDIRDTTSASVYFRVRGDGQTEVIDGTVAVPGLSFISDTDTGLRRAGADDVRIVTGGADRFIATNAGNYSRGVMYHTDGSVSAPAISFENNADTGIYRIGANNIGIATGGTKAIDISPSAVAVTGTLTASNLSGTNTGNQTITLTGDISGSGTGSFSTTLPTVNGNIGTFANATVTANAKGQITAISAGSAGGAITGTTSLNVSALAVGGMASIAKGTATARSSTTTMSADPDLVMTNVPTGKHRIELVLPFDTGAGGCRAQVTYPSGVSSSAKLTGITQSSGVTALFYQTITVSPASLGAYSSAGVDNKLIYISGIVETNASGTISVDWAQNSSNAASSALTAQAYMILTRLT